MKLSSIAFLGSILICGLVSVSGWAGFKKLPPEKRQQLERIAVAQGFHGDKDVKEGQVVPVRVRGFTPMKPVFVTRRRFRRCGWLGCGIPNPIKPKTTEAPTEEPKEEPTTEAPPTEAPKEEPTTEAPKEESTTRATTEAPKEEPTTEEPQEPPEDPEAKNMTLQQFVFALEQLEKAFPNLPADQMANKLRMLVGHYDDPVWRVMLNVNNPLPGVGKDVSPFDTSTDPQTFETLTQMLDHRIQNGAESGVIKTNANGDTVAFGHVITGATAGYDQQTILGMNNLFATTISGDLGQSGLANSKNPSLPIIGPAGQWQNGKYMLPSKAGFATHAEILGDIDGFNMGKRIQANPGKPLSQHMKEYYGGESSRRFDIFKQHTTRAELTQQVYRFANLYEYKNDGLLSSVLLSSGPELAVRRASEINDVANRAIATFCRRYSAEFGSWCL